MFNKSIFYDTDFGGIISFLDFEEIGVFAHEVCDGSTRAKDGRQIFYLGACTQGKIDASHLVRTVSPTHTEVSVFQVFA